MDGSLNKKAPNALNKARAKTRWFRTGVLNSERHFQLVHYHEEALHLSITRFMPDMIVDLFRDAS